MLEKDIWVVATLATLFEAAFAEHLTFKGGTSLSKVWRAIRRFSEDVDITYDIRAFAPDLVSGAGDEALPPTRSQEKRQPRASRVRLAEWVRDEARPIVEEGLSDAGFAALCRVEEERLDVAYEPIFETSGFVAPEVMVEFGARSTGEPRAGTGSRLVRIAVQRGGLVRTGVRAQHAPERQGQAPDRADSRAWARRLGEGLPAIFPGQAEQAAAYRLLSNKAVKMEHMPASHFEQTVERCRAERLVPAVQDTTALNYDGLSATSGLDDIGGGKGASGILAHVGVAVNAAGRPLGMFEADAEFRRAEGKDSVRWLAGLDRAQELARACPDARAAAVCDREGDFQQLISRAGETGAALSSGGDADRWDFVLATDPAGTRKIEVPACGGPNRRKGRTAKLTLRCAPVDLLPPKDRAGEAPVRMTAVSALEENPPRRPLKGKKSAPLHWMLLTAEGEAGLETARTALRRHGLCWRIERFFHALTVGTRIEDRRLNDADDLRKCLAFDEVTAFRVRDLSLPARERPDDPAERHIAREDVTVLCALAARHGFKVPRAPPDMTVKGFVVLTGGLAGFHPSKHWPLPGTQKLWEGVRFLSQAVIAVRAMRDWEGGWPEGEEDTEISMLD